MGKDEQILLCAFRYAYGRRTYIVDTVKKYISVRLESLSEEFLNLVLQEFRDFPIEKWGGDECDQKVWNTFKDEVIVELSNRTMWGIYYGIKL